MGGALKVVVVVVVVVVPDSAAVPLGRVGGWVGVGRLPTKSMGLAERSAVDDTLAFRCARSRIGRLRVLLFNPLGAAHR
jgi:hypothetical protein